MAKIVRAISTNAGIRAAYTRRILAELDAMQRSVAYWLKAAYGAREDEIVGDASPVWDILARFRKAQRMWLKRWDYFSRWMSRRMVDRIGSQTASSLAAAFRDAGFKENLSLVCNHRSIFTMPRPWLVTWPLLARPYQRARYEYSCFVYDNFDTAEGGSIFNAVARKQLGNILQREGLLRDKPTCFDFINTSWERWEDLYHTLRKVSGKPVKDGLTAALEAFTFRALAKGRTVPQGNGIWQIQVDQVAVFVHDNFNFEEEDWFYKNELGFWNCEKLAGADAFITGTRLRNEDFREWRQKHGMGGDFLVLSMPKVVDNFEARSYVYP